MTGISEDMDAEPESGPETASVSSMGSDALWILISTISCFTGFWLRAAGGIMTHPFGEGASPSYRRCLV